MESRIYNVILHTPMGDKHGVMSVNPASRSMNENGRGESLGDKSADECANSHGSMSVSSYGSSVSGEFNILRHSEPFDGVIDENGSCEIKGKIITLLKEIEYTAIGTIEDTAISLEVNCKGRKFLLSGTIANTTL